MSGSHGIRSATPVSAANARRVIGRAHPCAGPRGSTPHLIDAPSDAGAVVIGLDTLFPDPTEAPHDNLLHTALGRAGNVILARPDHRPAVHRQMHGRSRRLAESIHPSEPAHRTPEAETPVATLDSRRRRKPSRSKPPLRLSS